MTRKFHVGPCWQKCVLVHVTEIPLAVVDTTTCSMEFAASIELN